jgi:hypothetical protein
VGKLEWIEMKNVNVCKSFRLSEEPYLIHVIKTGFKDKYMVVHEDAFEVELGKVIIGTKAEIERLFNIIL